MILEAAKYILSALVAGGTLIVAGVTGAWVLWKFVLKQERYPLVEASADLTFIGVHRNQWVVELAGYVDNKGTAQHKMLKFDFELFALEKNERLSEDEESNELEFPLLLKQGSFLKQFEYLIVNAGVKAKYSFVTTIPKNIAFLHLKTEFKYEDKRDYFHSAECTKAVPALPTKPS